MSPSTPTYGSLIKAYGMLKRPKKCWQMWKEMTELRGLKPTDIVIGCMLDALVCNSLVDDAEQIFAEQSYPPNVIL
jgi:pentatricopeptide repeat protein